MLSVIETYILARYRLPALSDILFGYTSFDLSLTIRIAGAEIDIAWFLDL